MQRVVIAQPHVFYLIVCAIEDASKQEIEDYANKEHPSGVSSPWKIDDDPELFREFGSDNPGKCEDTAGRLHYKLIC